MPRIPRAAAGPSASSGDAATLLAALEHPHTAAILAVRDVLRSVDPAVREGVKWNAPSYYTAEHFATFQLRHRDGVQMVLHLGARPRPDTGLREGIADPSALLDWRGPDRATVTFADRADVEAKRPAFEAVLRQWLTFVS